MRRILIAVVVLFAFGVGLGAGRWIGVGTQPIEEVPSASALAERIGCTQAEDATRLQSGQFGAGQPALDEAVVCRLDGVEDPVVVYHFLTVADRNAWLNVALPRGGVYLEGVNWLVNADSNVLGNLRRRHGGVLLGLGQASCCGA